MERYRYLLIGGDRRQECLFDLLKNKGKCVDSIYLYADADETTLDEKITEADIIILPVPSCVDGKHLFTPKISRNIVFSSVIEKVKDDTILFAGGENSAVTASKARKKVNLLSDEVMTLKNAMATAEAAISILIRETEITLFGSKILLIGYGRIAKILSEYLISLNANVTVCARKEIAKTHAELSGCSTIGFDQLNEKLIESEIIINTVPAMVLDKKELAVIKKDAIILDLASRPGGVNFNEAERLSIKTIHALSLPGKFSPITAAEFIEQAINSVIT